MGSGEVEENVNRFFENPGESTFQRNARRELGTFFDKLDVTALLGVRKATSVNGETVTFNGMVAGVVYPISLIKVFSTGTTATFLVGLV